MKDVAMWLWGAMQGACGVGWTIALKAGVPCSGPDTPWWVIVILLITVFGNAAALAFLTCKFKKYW